MTAFLVHVSGGIARGSAPSDEWAAALDKLAYRGPHGIATVSIDHARFSAANRRVSQRDGGITQPLVDDGGVVVVFDGRLDAAAELGAALGVPNGAPLPADAELVASCYRRHGEAFAARLDGEFALVLYDPSRRLLIASRDLFGSRMLYWARSAAGLFLSNELPALRSIRGIDDALDPLAVADYLVFGYVDFFDKSRTPFRGVHALPPAACLIDSDGTQRIARHRAFSDLLRPVSGLTPATAPEAFREAMSAAVEERLDADRALIPLSGGLDSTSIAAAAAKACRSGRARSKLKAYTGLRSGDDVEAQFARSVASRLQLSHELFMPERDSLLATPMPSWYPVTQFFANGGGERSRRLYADADVVLYGSAGDSVLHPERATLLGIMRSHGLRYAIHGWRTLRSQGRSLSLGTGLGGGRQASEALTVTRADKAPSLPAWLDRGFVAECRLQERLEETLRWRPPDALHPVHPNAQFLLQWANWFWGFFPVGTRFTPPEWTDPFLDFRVLSVVFALPAEPWLHGKHLVRQAGRDELPVEVLSRPKTPAGNYVASWIEALDRTVLDGWQMSPELACFVDRSAVPPIDMSVEGSNSYLNFRPMMLQRWYSCLQDW